MGVKGAKSGMFSRPRVGGQLEDGRKGCQ